MKKKILIAIAVLVGVLVAVGVAMLTMKNKPITLGQQLPTVDTKNMPDEEKIEQMQKMFEQTDFADSEIEKIEQPYLDKHGCIPKSKVQTVLKKVFSWAEQQYEQGLITYVSFEPDNECVYINFSTGIGYMYEPEVFERLSAGEEIKIATFDLINKKSFTVEGNLENLKDNLGVEYVLADIFTEQEITIEDIKRLGDYKIVIWFGHGGYGKKTRSNLSMPKGTVETIKDNPDYFDDIQDKSILIKKKKCAATSLFFLKYFSSDCNTEIYLGACSSGKDRVLADAFLTKGASIVCAYTHTVSMPYESGVRKTLFQYLHRSKQDNKGTYSWPEALEKATSGNMKFDWAYPIKQTKPILYFPQKEIPHVTGADSREIHMNSQLEATTRASATSPRGTTTQSLANSNGFAGGDGTIQNPYQISTPEQLNNVRNYMSASYILVNDIDLAGWGNWEPIGNEKNAFSGSLDGNDHIIKDISINTTNSQTTGLFVNISNASIKNLGLVGGNIEYSGSHGAFVGAFAGGASGAGLLENCYSTCNVSATCEYGENTVGGIVGVIAISANYEIRNCYTSGNIHSISPGGCAGGIIGAGSTIIIKCYSTGDISNSSKGVYSNTSISAGGIVGRFGGGSIDNCYSSGEINASCAPQEKLTVGPTYAGGIIGFAPNSCFIDHCYVSGNITAKNPGGIIGEIYGNYYNRIEISNCYYSSSTNVTAISHYDDNNEKYFVSVRTLTASQMKQQSSYTGFDFNTIWDISPDINNGHPYLRGLQP